MRRPPPRTLRELEIRAGALQGRTVGELAAAIARPLPPEPRLAKGFVGSLVEAALGADPAAGADPDFPELAVELKSVPVGARGQPVESTFVCSVTMATADRESWSTSRLRRRLRRVLWIPVQSARLAPLAERRFGCPILWSPSAADEELLRSDWEHLVGAIGAGRGGSLTAREGRILQVRPKASSSRVRTLAPGPDGPARTLPLGFYLRASFTATILARAP